MTRTNIIALWLCLGLLAPQLVHAQASNPSSDDPLADLVGDEEDASTAQRAKRRNQQDSVEEQPALDEQPAMASVPPTAEESDGAAQKLKAAELSASGKASGATGEQSEANKERCAQLMAQGQVALAQAEGCGGGDQPIWAGTIVSFTQTTAPAFRYLPDNDNAFYALSLYVAPRLTLTKKWAVNADATLAYEATQADDTTYPHEALLSDTRLLFNGNLGSFGGFTFTGGPRISLPTSKASWAADVYAGLGAGLNIIRSVDVLDGLSFISGGSYQHVFSGRLTRKIRADDVPTCKDTRSENVDCPAGNVRVAQDSFRAVGAASLNFTSALNMQLAYVYSWSLAKPFAGDAGLVDESTTRIRRVGSASLSFSYQPLPWLIAALQGNTTVCYDSPFGGQSAFGGCAGGTPSSDWWLRNPIANKFSTVGLQLTVPVDALYEALRSKESESRSAKVGRAKPRL